MKPAIPLAIALAAIAFPSLTLRKDLKTNQVGYEYVPPANATQKDLHDRLRSLRVLERMSEFLSPLRLPRPLTLRIQGCDGRINAYYWDYEIIVCYEYFDFLLKFAPEMPTPEGLTRRDALAGMTADVFLHEAGHAVFDMLEIPFLGREEDAADQVSAYILLQMAKDSARRLILGVAYLGSEQAQGEMAHPAMLSEFADIHELPAQRYFNMLCMAYGEDPDLFADAVDYWHLPKSRAKNCPYEYRRFQYAYRALIEPYVDQRLVEKVKAKQLLTFAPAE